MHKQIEKHTTILKLFIGENPEIYEIRRKSTFLIMYNFNSVLIRPDWN